MVKNTLWSLIFYSIKYSKASHQGVGNWLILSLSSTKCKKFYKIGPLDASLSLLLGVIKLQKTMGFFLSLFYKLFVGFYMKQTEKSNSERHPLLTSPERKLLLMCKIVYFLFFMLVLLRRTSFLTTFYGLYFNQQGTYYRLQFLLGL